MSVITNLTSTDITQRLQQAKCCISDLAYKTANSFAYGLSIAECSLEKLELLNIWSEILCDYQALNDTESKASGTFRLVGGDTGTIILYVNGVQICNAVTYTTSLANTATLIKNAINSYTSSPDYTATVLGTEITITASDNGSFANGYIITYTATSGGGAGISMSGQLTFFTGGDDIIIEDDNCLTEEEAQSMFEKLALKCDQCFQSNGYTYKS